MIRLRHVSCEYEPGSPVLKDVTLTIGDDESVGLIGANGAGKSTLFKVLLGLLPYKGEVLVDDAPVEARHLKEIRKKLGFVLQNSDNQMFMPTVLEDLMFAPRSAGMSREEAEAKADEALRRLGIEDLKHRYNHKISGGEKRMAAIAAVLTMEPDTLLMDEPTSALDPYNRRRIIDTIRALPVTRVIASHDLDMIADTCERVILLSDGAVVADGDADEILRDRALLERHRLELPFRYAPRA